MRSTGSRRSGGRWGRRDNQKLSYPTVHADLARLGDGVGVGGA